jgi:hypothetical protein
MKGEERREKKIVYARRVDPSASGNKQTSPYLLL